MTSFKPPATSNRPDGDTDLGLVDYSKFVVPDCDKCGGMLKPEVVFFGENVPLDIVKKAMDLIHEVTPYEIKKGREKERKGTKKRKKNREESE